MPNDKLSIDGERYEYVVGMEVGLEPSTIAVALRDDVGGDTSYITAKVDPAG